MYSVAGKRLMNLVLSSKRPTLATHIALGINTVYDASIDGTTEPATHNFISSPYVVEYIPIRNIGIVAGTEGDEIIFNGEATVSKLYVANNMGLTCSASGIVPDQYIIAGIGQDVWVDNGSPALPIEPLTPKYVFSNDGMIQTNNTAIYNGEIFLNKVDLKSIIAMPLFFIAAEGAPTGSIIKITLHGTLDEQTFTSVFQDTIVNSVAPNPVGYKFSGDSKHNVAPAVAIDEKPVPFLFQKRLSAGTNIDKLLNTRTIIKQLDVNVSGGKTIQFGDITIAPTIDDSLDLTNVSYRRLSSILYKTEDEAYVNAEYRIVGIV